MVDMLLPAMGIYIIDIPAPSRTSYDGYAPPSYAGIGMPLPGPPICWIIGYTPPCYGY